MDFDLYLLNVNFLYPTGTTRQGQAFALVPAGKQVTFQFLRDIESYHCAKNGYSANVLSFAKLGDVIRTDEQVFDILTKTDVSKIIYGGN